MGVAGVVGLQAESASMAGCGCSTMTCNQRGEHMAGAWPGMAGAWPKHGQGVAGAWPVHGQGMARAWPGPTAQDTTKMAGMASTEV